MIFTSKSRGGSTLQQEGTSPNSLVPPEAEVIQGGHKEKIPRVFQAFPEP